MENTSPLICWICCAAWLSADGKSQTRTTVHQTVITAANRGDKKCGTVKGVYTWRRVLLLANPTSQMRVFERSAAD